MKTIELITSGKKTTIFVDKIKYIREQNSTETLIQLDRENTLVAKISYSSLLEKINNV